MREIQATEAKTRLAELLRVVEHGETVAITRHGKPVAHLVPAPVQESRKPRKGGRAFPAAPRRVGTRGFLHARQILANATMKTRWV